MNYLNKVIVLITCFLMISISSVYTQIGVKAGFNYSTVNGIDSPNDAFDVEFRTGYQFGLLYNLGIGDKFALQPEVAFNQSGYESSISNQNISSETRYNYLNLTALLEYNLIGTNDGFRLQLLGGAFTEYLISGKNIFEVNEILEEVEMDLSSNFAPNRANLGFVYGLGLGFNSFFLHLRSSVGLVDVDEINVTGQNGDLIGQGHFSTRDYSIVVGYTF